MAEIAKKTKSNPVKKISKFFGDLKGEVKRITWPTKQQTFSGTLAVLVSCILIGGFIAIVDFVLANVLQFFVSR